MASITPQPPVDEAGKREPGTHYGAPYGARANPPSSGSGPAASQRGSSSARWDHAKHALQSAWQRLERAVHHERRH